MASTDPVAIAWAAGIFEGEGSISISRNQIRLKLGMTDGDIIARFAGIVGCGSTRIREEMRQPHWKPCWYWEAARLSDCVGVMALFLPHLGDRRSARWAEVLAQRAALRPEKSCPECGEAFKPIRVGQVCCGHDCSWRHTRRVGKHTSRAPNTKTVVSGYASSWNERRAAGLLPLQRGHENG